MRRDRRAIASGTEGGGSDRKTRAARRSGGTAQASEPRP